MNNSAISNHLTVIMTHAPLSDVNIADNFIVLTELMCTANDFLVVQPIAGPVNNGDIQAFR